MPQQPAPFSNFNTDAFMPAPAEPSDDDLNAQVAALLASGAQDMGEPTEAVHLDTLSDTEKRVLLALLRERMGQTPVLSAPLAPMEKAGRRP